MTWWSGSGQTKRHPVIQRLLGGEKSIHLLARLQKKPYIYFGTITTEPELVEDLENGQIKVNWILKDYAALSTNPIFVQVAASAQEQ